MRVLVSACLLGAACRYDGKSVPCKELQNLLDQYELIPVCPEQLGGLPTPREPAEQVGEAVITTNGLDVTNEYERGAHETLRLALLFNCNVALLKAKSPSCGSGQIYDGTFQRRLITGDGKTTTLLKQAGMVVFNETEIPLLLKTLKEMEEA